MPRWSARLVAALVAALVACPLAAPAAPARADAGQAAAASPVVPGPVVLVGTGGLRWDDLDSSTPVLAALLGASSVATSAVRSVRTVTCPVDGWLTVSTGRRAADPAQPSPAGAGTDPAGCRPVPAPRPTTGAAAGGPVTVPRWDVYRDAAAQQSFDAVPGLLGDQLARAGLPSAAVGPGAAIALADGAGRVAAAWPGVPARPDGAVDPDEGEGALSEQVEAALARRPALLVVDVGAVRDPARGGVAPGTPDDPAPSREEQVEAVDGRLAAVLGALPESATVVVASLADAGDVAQLQLTAAFGAAPGGGRFDAGFLRSASTRQDALVQSTDLLPTLLAALGTTVPAGVPGAPLTRVGSDGGDLSRLQHLRDLSGAAETVDPIVTPFVVVLVALQLLVVGGLAAVLARTSGAARTPGGASGPVRTRRRLLRAGGWFAVAAALVPAATFLANLWPWWRSRLPGLELSLAVLTFTLPLALVALLGPWRRSLLGPAGVAGALTALVLTADVATGSGLSLTTLIGGQPLVAGRFYGFSNPGFALFATGALLAAAALAEALLRRGGPADRRTAALAVAAVGLAATVVDVAPALGADFGGPLAIVPAFAYLALRVGGVRLTWRRGLLVAAGTVGVLAAACVADWLRPPQDRTHLGRFVQSVLDGDAAVVVQRKAAQNLDILTSSPLNLLLPFVAAAVVVVLARPVRWHVAPLQTAYEASAVLRDALVALGLLLLVGFLVNDSGTAVPPVAALLALPLLVAVCLRAVEAEDEHLAAGPGGRGGRGRTRAVRV